MKVKNDFGQKYGGPNCSEQQKLFNTMSIETYLSTYEFLTKFLCGFDRQFDCWTLSLAFITKDICQD